MAKLTDDSKIPFGKHKYEKMANVPSGYLMWFYNKNKDEYEKGSLYGVFKDVFEYIADNLDVIEKEEAKEETNRNIRRNLSYK